MTKEVKIDASINDWIIFDGSELINKRPHSLTIELVLRGFNDKQFNLANQEMFKIPKDLYGLFELESIENLSPNDVSSYFLVHSSTSFFNI